MTEKMLREIYFLQNRLESSAEAFEEMSAALTVPRTIKAAKDLASIYRTAVTLSRANYPNGDKQ